VRTAMKNSKLLNESLQTHIKLKSLSALPPSPDDLQNDVQLPMIDVDIKT